MTSINLVANTDLRSESDFRQLVVGEDQGTVVRLSDVAEIELGAENYDTDVRFSGQKAMFMGIWVLPTANGQRFPRLRTSSPRGSGSGFPTTRHGTSTTRCTRCCIP